MGIQVEGMSEKTPKEIASDIIEKHTNFLSSREKKDQWPQKVEYLSDRIVEAIEQERLKVTELEKVNGIMKAALELIAKGRGSGWTENGRHFLEIRAEEALQALEEK